MSNTTTTINTLPSAARQAGFESPSEQLITLTYGQLQGLIVQAVQEAIQPLQDRVLSLESIIALQGEKIAALEATANLHEENQLIQLRLIHQLREATKKEPVNDSPLLDELYKEMKAIGRKQTDFATAARMVKRSKRRMLQLKTTIALDHRFILIPSERHPQKVLIRLRES